MSLSAPAVPPGAPAAAVNACAALLNLCTTSEQSQREVLSTGGLPLVISLLKPGEASAAGSAAKLLAALARLPEARALFSEDDTVELLVALAENGARAVSYGISI